MERKLTKNQKKKLERKAILERNTVRASVDEVHDEMMFYEDHLDSRWFYKDWVAAGRPRDDRKPNFSKSNYTKKEQKLLNRPIEHGSLITKELFITFTEFQALFECWSWQGVNANSIIILKSDFNNFDMKSLIQSLFEQMQMPLDPSLTLSETGEYVFINFNFTTN